MFQQLPVAVEHRIDPGVQSVINDTTIIRDMRAPLAGITVLIVTLALLEFIALGHLGLRAGKGDSQV